MSILIKGIKKPETCKECKFFAWKRIIGNYCAMDENIIFHTVLDFDSANLCYERIGECPLIEVPTPHGRLIDADELLRHKGDAYDSEGHLLYAVGTGSIIAAPTIIEAEEGE